MSHYSNPTANAAMGSVDREIKLMRKRAEQLKRRRQRGQLTPAELAQARREFVGIYRRFLKEALEDEAPGQGGTTAGYNSKCNTQNNKTMCKP